MEQHTTGTVQHTTVVIVKHKSVGTAFLLSLFFGPLGLLYASVMGGIAMMVLGAIIGFFTLGFGLLFVWPACIVWAVIAVNIANKKASSQIHGA